VADDFCPPTATPAETLPAPEGWRAWRTDEARAYKLADVTFTGGPPDERVFLSPASTSRQGGARVDSYDFTSPTLRDVWVVCQYRNTTIALVRQTDFHGKRCEASYAKNGQASEVKALSCK
jgi:hypothetical protein